MNIGDCLYLTAEFFEFDGNEDFANSFELGVKYRVMKRVILSDGFIGITSLKNEDTDEIIRAAGDTLLLSTSIPGEYNVI